MDEMLKINHAGINLIKSFESLRTYKYICPSGYSTIGYGHVLLPNENLEKITEDEAEELLYKDIILAEQAVLRNIYINLSSNQFAALVSFTFNVGGAALQRSTLRSKINNHEHHYVPSEFMKWIYGGGRKLLGLINRRRKETELYLGI